MKSVFLGVGAVLALAGCTQIAQLQPVAGAQVTAVRIATNDVLVEKGVRIGVAPVCALEDPVYVCSGSTVGGREIRSEAEVLQPFGAGRTEYGADTPADVTLRVTVGGREIFNGKVEDVLVQNAQEG